MNEKSSHQLRTPPKPSNRVRPALEVLEDRVLLSVDVVEAEPNNSPASANVLVRVPETTVAVRGEVSTLGDRDWFRIELQAGDVLGAASSGQNNLNPALRLLDSTGQLMIANDDCLLYGATYLPPESPLPHNRTATDAEVYYVISAPGTYYIEVSASGDASTGKYKLDMVIARPALEQQPVGAKQILFLDFDGALVNFSHFGNQILSGNRAMSPLAESLSKWTLTAADLDPIIDGILAKVTDKLSTFVRSNGLNGDFDGTGIPGQFGIEIRNSRDHADQFGTNPLVSRMVVGAINDTDVTDVVLGVAQYADVGNLKTNDQGVAFVDFLEGGLMVVPRDPSATPRDFVIDALANIVTHEAGHFFGCWHTDQSPDDMFAGTPNLMDTIIQATLGPDGVFGTADDLNWQLGLDSYSRDEIFQGRNDTLNTVSFGLATGKGSTSASSTVSRQVVSKAGLAGTALFAFDMAGGLNQESISKDPSPGPTISVRHDGAAGWGWISATPRDDSEFITPGGEGSRGHTDLLAQLEREPGHQLGLERTASGVTVEIPATRTSRTLPFDLDLRDLAVRDGIFADVLTRLTAARSSRAS